MNSLFEFFDDPIEDEDIVDVPKKTLDLFKEVLPAIDRGDYKFYNNLSEAQKKGYEPYIISRWITATSDNSYIDFLMNSNDIVNVDFWTLTEHPELQHMLMCIVHKLSATRKNVRHHWVPLMGSKRKVNEVRVWILDKFPQLSDQELDILLSMWSESDFKDFVRLYGTPESELKKLMKAWADLNKNGKK